MVGQTLFFEKFYLHTKITQLEKNMEKLSVQYSNEEWDSTNIVKNLNRFSDENNVQIAVLDENRFVKYIPNFDILLNTASSGRVRIPLTNVAFLEDFQSLNLTLDSEIAVEGYFNSDFSNVFSIVSIKKDNKKWENINLEAASMSAEVAISPVDSESHLIEGQELLPSIQISGVQEGLPVLPGAIATYGGYNSVAFRYEKISGIIEELNIPSQIELLTNYNNDLLWSSIDYWNWQYSTGKMVMEQDQITAFHYKGASDTMDHIVFVKPIIHENKMTEFLFVISSLQPVGEAVNVMKGYYLYAIMIAIVLVAVMSLLFSRIIANPLIKMNKVAGKMADFDFSEECVIKSNDELGNLAGSLNRLSMNLGTSLVELKSANQQLQADIEKERNLEKMRKEFISSVSHEFKTPLGVIKGFAEGIKDNIAEEKKSYYIDVILDEIEKMDELVLELLDLAKLESKVQELKIEKFNIIYLIDEMISRLSKSVSEKNINMKFKYEDINLDVYGDRKRIEQVITNILSNAIRHVHKGGYIVIGTEIKEGELIVYIENNGDHIDQEDLPKIWDRFYRVEKSRDKKSGGTGLGLAIVKNILDLHESQFGVENTNESVKFYFTLRLKE
jgi:signal transduction histidine kinase